MSRITPLNIEETNPATARTLAAIRTKLGGVPNMFAILARSQAGLDGYVKLADSLSGGYLSHRQRELIAIAIAQENSCEYCLSAHAAIGKGIGLGVEEITLARAGKSVDSSDDAIIKFALAVLRDRGAVSEEALAAIRKHGKDDGLLIEITANVALNILTNYINRLAGTVVDFPLLRLAAAA